MKKILMVVQSLGFKLLCFAAVLAKASAVIGVASASAWGKHQPPIPSGIQARR